MTESSQPPKPSSIEIKEHATVPTRASKPSKPPKARNIRLYGALALSVVLAGLLVWQFVRVGQVRREYKAERKALIIAQERALKVQAEQLLRTSGSLLGAAIHNSLVAEDFEAIEKQIKSLLVEKGILVVAVADNAGKIRVATNHRLEGQNLSEAFAGLSETASSGVVVTTHENGLIAVATIAGSDAPIGRAVIFYAGDR